MIGKWHPCPKRGCPELVNRDNPCPRPGHMRPRNASWSRDRDPRAHAAFAKRVLAQANGVCQRCGRTDLPLQAHHTQRDEGIGVCSPCHKAIDPHAR